MRDRIRKLKKRKEIIRNCFLVTVKGKLRVKALIYFTHSILKCFKIRKFRIRSAKIRLNFFHFIYLYKCNGFCTRSKRFNKNLDFYMNWFRASIGPENAQNQSQYLHLEGYISISKTDAPSSMTIQWTLFPQKKSWKMMA